MCGIFPDQGWNPCLLHEQTDSLPLRHHGSPQLLLNIYHMQSAVLRVAWELIAQHFGLGEALSPQERRHRMQCLAILGEKDDENLLCKFRGRVEIRQLPGDDRIWTPFADMNTIQLWRKLAAGAVEAGPLSTRDHKEYYGAIKFINSKTLNKWVNYSYQVIVNIK